MPQDMSPGSGFGTSPTSGADDRSSPRAQVNDLKDSVTDDLKRAREALSDGRDTVTEKLNDTISEQASFVARQVGGIASALEKVGAELEQGDQPQVGRYARQIGSSAQDLASRMDGKDTGEIARMAEDFGRRQPLAFLGMAALAGLAASRFLTASAKRTSDTTSTPAPERGPTATNANISGRPASATSTAYGTGGSTHGKI